MANTKGSNPLKIFTVYDSKAEAYLQPFFAKTTGLATRDFEAASNSEDHQFYKYPGDYTLFELGTFNENSAKFTQTGAPLNLGTAISYQGAPNPAVVPNHGFPLPKAVTTNE